MKLTTPGSEEVKQGSMSVHVHCDSVAAPEFPKKIGWNWGGCTLYERCLQQKRHSKMVIEGTVAYSCQEITILTKCFGTFCHLWSISEIFLIVKKNCIVEGDR